MATAKNAKTDYSKSELLDNENAYENVNTKKDNAINDNVYEMLMHENGNDRNEAAAETKNDQLKTQRANQWKLRVLFILLVFCLLLAGAALITSLITSSNENNYKSVLKLENKLEEMDRRLTDENNKSVLKLEDKLEEMDRRLTGLLHCREYITDVYGSGGGAHNFSDYAYYRDGGAPTQLLVRWGQLRQQSLLPDQLYCVGFRYGTVLGPCNGGHYGSLHTYDFHSGEYIKEIQLTEENVQMDEIYYIVNKIKFITNERTLGPYPPGQINEEDIIKAFGVTGAEKLIYISGRFGGAIDTIRFHFSYC